MERPSFIDKGSVVTELKGGMKSDAVKVETPDGNSYIIKRLKKRFQTAKKAHIKAEKLKKQYDELKSYLGPYVQDTEFRVEKTSKEGYVVYTIQKFLENGISFQEGLTQAKKSGRTRHFLEFLTLSSIMYSEIGASPDITGNRHVVGWRWRELETTENAIVINGPTGDPMPILVDVGFISGEPPGMKQMHNWRLSRSFGFLQQSINNKS